MPFDGNGSYNLPSTTVTPAIADTTIDEVGFNSFTDDIETALSQCVTNDGQTTNPRIDDPYLNEAVAMTSTSTELNLLDGATVTTAEINNIDGGAADASTTIVDADQIVINNGGTMEQTAVTDLDTYLSATTKTLTNKTLTTPTLTSPVINTGVSGTGVKDDDTMADDSATHICTQQSIKAYVDAVDTKIASLNTKIIDISTWNMDTTATKNIAHGLTVSKIRTISAIIADNTGVTGRDFVSNQNATAAVGSFYADATNINLTRATGSVFDAASWNAATGWVTIQYTD